MELKTTVQGSLIYAAMAAYLAAFLLHLAGHLLGKKTLRTVGMAVYGIGAALALVSFSYRASIVQRVPFRDLFEVMLFVGLVMYPVTLFCRYVLRIGGEAGDMLLAAIALFPSGFVFDATPRPLMPALQSPLFMPHVASYMLAYAVLAKASVQAGCQLVRGLRHDAELIDHERATYRLVMLGFPLLTLGLILGAWWGKIAWGDWWNWDPKEMWSLASWLVFLVYLHFRRLCGRRFPRVNSVCVLSGMTVIIITLLWVNFSKLFSGLHSYAS